MRQRKRRLCTALLCAVLIISNVLPAGMPVYAKSPDTGSDIMSTASSNETVTPMAENSTVEAPAASDGTDKQTGAETDNNADSSNTNDNNMDSGSESDSGNSNDSDADTSGENVADNSPDGSNSDANNDNGSSNSDANTDSDDSDSNGDTGDDSTNDNSYTVDDTVIEDNPAEKDTPNVEGDVTVSGNDAEEDSGMEDDTPSVINSYGASDYLTEDPLGYNLTDITMTPGSYSAEFSAASNEDIYYDQLKILYTTDFNLADNFFKGKSIITAEDLSASSFKIGEFINFDSDYTESAFFGVGFYNLSGTFVGNDTLIPDTTYHYRLVYYDYTDYYFLTIPEQFTTSAPVEDSSVSVRNLTIEETGYQKAKIVWSIDNPNKEALSSMTLRYTDSEGTQSADITPQQYRDKNSNTIPNKYYATIDLDWARKAKVILTTYTGSGDAKNIESDEITITPKDIHDATLELTTKTGTGSLQAIVELSPYSYADGYINYYLYYRSKSDTSWNRTNGYTSGNVNSTSVSATIQVFDLSSNTEYEYYIKPTGRLAQRTFENLGSEEAPLNFTTKEVITYEDSAFPDEVFRSLIKKQIGIDDSEQISSDKLEKMTYINWKRSSANVSDNISSLQGIEHLENLTAIDFSGHTITNVGGLSSLTSLTSIALTYNDLTELPDLSGMSNLTYAGFTHNRIKTDTITESKLPASLLAKQPDWISSAKRYQRGETKVTLAPEYYAIGETRPFLIQVTNLKGDFREYILSLTIDGKTVSGTGKEGSIYYIKDILKDSTGADTEISIAMGVPYEAVITLTDSYGNEWLNQTESITFAPPAANTAVVITQYVPPNASFANIHIQNLPPTYTADNIASVTLVDQSGKPVGNALPSYVGDNTGWYNAYESVFGSLYIGDLTSGMTVDVDATVFFTKYLSSGDYSAVITTNDGTSSTFEKAVSVDNVAVVEHLQQADYGSDGRSPYDNYGDYLYVRLYGTNIDPTKVRPIFYEGDEAITQYVSHGEDYGDIIYKLKKLKKDTYWNISGFKTFVYKLQADEGYTVIDYITDKSITLSDHFYDDFIVSEHYNYKKGVYEVKTDSTVKDGTIVSVSVHDNSSSRVIMGTAQSEITNSLLLLDFKNDRDESYAPPCWKEAYFTYTYIDSAGRERTFEHTNEHVDWYNYYPSGSVSNQNSAYTNMILYYKALLKKLDLNVFIPTEKIQAGQPIDAQLYTNAGRAAVGEKVSLSGKSVNEYINYTGTWQSTEGLKDGIYQIRYSQNGRHLYSHNIYVCDDEKFYMNNQWMDTLPNNSEGRVYIKFSSEQLAANYILDYNSTVDAETALAYWNNCGYKLELFDRLGNPISGWNIDHASWTDSNFYLYLQDIPEEYAGYYAKITRAGKPGVRLEDEVVYYSTNDEANEEYGVWYTILNRWERHEFIEDISINAYYGFRTSAYPVTVAITTLYDTDIIHSFNVSAATSGDHYYFTAADLQPLKPDEVYRVMIVWESGNFSCSWIGYLAVKDPDLTIDADDVTLDKTTLNMLLNQTEKLIATVKPDNATNQNVTWSTSNASVATVDTQGNVIAVGSGKAEITATTHNGKTATCIVQIFNYTLNKTELSFDLSSTGTSDQTEILTVNDGTNDISSSVTWSSSDENVVSISKDGVVTPQGVGKAKILAEIENVPPLICDVTVSRDTLTGITLNESACTLYLDSNGQPVSQMPNTQSLKLYLTPSDSTFNSISWISDEPAVASVLADEKDPATAVVTALTKGTATITATVATKSKTRTAKCKITVQMVTTEADVLTKPTGLTALTNEQLTLEDVALPTGWEWLYPDLSLKQFAGLQAKAFAAKYTDPVNPDAIPYETELSVALSTVTGIVIGADSNSLRQGTDTALSVIWNMNGAQLDLSAYAGKVTWSSPKESVAKVNPASGTTTTLTAQGPGTTTVMAQVTFKDGKTYKSQYKVTVIDGEVADIQVTAVDNFTPDAALQGTYRGKLDSNATNNNGTVHVTVIGATKLTVKNNNAKVITTGKVTAEGSGYSIPLTIKAAGMAKITLTANDKAKTQKDIFLYVSDVKPNISEDTVTVNLWQTTGTTFILYPNEGYQVISAALAGDNASKFTLTKAETAGADTTQAKYVITAADGTAKGSYKLTLQGKVKSGTEEFDYNNVAFTVKVIEQAPKYKIKQSSKINLFYKNWENSILEVTSDEVLESMELTGCDFTVENPNGSWRLKATSSDLTTTCNKKGILKLRFTGYKDVTANFTVNVEKKAPTCTLRNKSMTVYPAAGLDSAVLNPLVYRPDGNLYGDVNYRLDKKTANAGFILTHEYADQTGDFLIKYTKGTENLKNTTYKASFTLTHSSWTDPVTVLFTIKVNGNIPAAKLGKATLQLNTNTAAMAYDAAATTVMWKDGVKFDPLNVSVSAADAKSRSIINSGIVFAYDRTGNQVIAKLNNTAVAKGNYKFKVNVKATDTLTVSTPLTIKIVDVVMDKAIKISTKGSIDVLNRSGTFVTATPALKSINGNLTGVRLSGRAAHLFIAECADNKVIIHAKPNAALITKYNYKVKLDLTIENAEGATIRYTTPEISLKLKQGKPKVTVIPKNATFFSGSYEGITRNVSATLKGAENPAVTNVELINNNETFTCDYADGVITLRNTPNAIKGKTYSLQFRVTFYGQADNEKATTVKYTVKVK